jgi:hypothetical protein
MRIVEDRQIESAILDVAGEDDAPKYFIKAIEQFVRELAANYEDATGFRLPCAMENGIEGASGCGR